MSALRTLVESAITEVVNEHPKYFTPRGKEHIRSTVVRKVMAAFRDATKENESGESENESATAVIRRDEPMFAKTGSREGQAYHKLCIAGGAVVPLTIGGAYRIPACAAINAVWTFADAPALSAWKRIDDKRQIAAWLGFFADTLAGVARRPIVRNGDGMNDPFDERRYIIVPWPWPPRKDGSLSQQSEEIDEEV